MANKTTRPSRRGFFKTCLATATLVAANPALVARAGPVRQYNRVLLVDHQGEPVTSNMLSGGGAFLFHYPYITTPCFLMDIGREAPAIRDLQMDNGESYTWQGGSGPGASLVAFSAICAHKLSYPTRSISFINYRPGNTRFMDDEEQVRERSQVIYCCSERSVYDPARGAAVIGGPARQPLTAVELEYDDQADHYYATGTRGGELYEEFFQRFEFRVALEHGVDDVRTLSEEKAEVLSQENYSSQPVSC
jgi:Rieske Fe-S protein